MIQKLQYNTFQWNKLVHVCPSDLSYRSYVPGFYLQSFYDLLSLFLFPIVVPFDNSHRPNVSCGPVHLYILLHFSTNNLSSVILRWRTCYQTWYLSKNLLDGVTRKKIGVLRSDHSRRNNWCTWFRCHWNTLNLQKCVYCNKTLV